MIITLEGKITHKELNFVILENNGIGYQIFLPDAGKAPFGEATKLFIYEHIREDKHDLYGFFNFDEMGFFLKLLSVSGVGPKMAQAIMTLGIEKVQKAIIKGDSGVIESISGVGKKRAQTIILELRGNINKMLEKENINQDVLSALVGLGYSRNEAEEVLQQLSEEISGTEAQLKAALKLMGKK